MKKNQKNKGEKRDFKNIYKQGNKKKKKKQKKNNNYGKYFQRYISFV